MFPVDNMLYLFIHLYVIGTITSLVECGVVGICFPSSSFVVRRDFNEHSTSSGNSHLSAKERVLIIVRKCLNEYSPMMVLIPWVSFELSKVCTKCMIVHPCLFRWNLLLWINLFP